MPTLVKTVDTVGTDEEAIVSMYEAYRLFQGPYPTTRQLGCVASQLILETGHLKACKNYNVGNLKVGRSYVGDYCMYPAGEIIKGRHVMFYPPHRETWFRAYRSFTDGMIDYLRLILTKERYRKAAEELVKGDPYGFGEELGKAGYYTWNRAKYTVELVNIFDSILDDCDLVCNQPLLTEEERAELVAAEEKMHRVMVFDVLGGE